MTFWEVPVDSTFQHSVIPASLDLLRLFKPFRDISLTYPATSHHAHSVRPASVQAAHALWRLAHPLTPTPLTEGAKQQVRALGLVKSPYQCARASWVLLMSLHQPHEVFICEAVLMC